MSDGFLKYREISDSIRRFVWRLKICYFDPCSDTMIIHVTALSAGTKKQSKTFINSRNFYKVRKTRFVATYAIASHQKVLVGLDSLYFKIKSFNNCKTTIPTKKKNMIWLNFTLDEEVFSERVTK